MSLINEISAKDNRLMVFFRNENSWHGVLPLNDLPEGVIREAL